MEKLINEYKETATNIVLLQNQILAIEKDLSSKKEELSQLSLKCQAISIALAIQESDNTNLSEKCEEVQ